MIYLDNAASTPLLPQVKEKLISSLDVYGNPSSIHEEGKKAKLLIQEAKNIISAKLNCSDEELYFTSGATMSNCILLQGFKNYNPSSDVYISSIEHDDIILMANEYHFHKISVNGKGFLNAHYILNILNERKENNMEYLPILFSIQMANSEIGTIQNIFYISKEIHRHPNAYLHVDATQYIPYFEVDVQELEIDALSMSGQKIGCIKGIGLLYISHRLQPHLSPIIYGEQGYIGGTENVLGIVCLGEAFKCLDYDNAELIKLRNKLIYGLNGILIGANVNRLPNNVCMMFEGIDAHELVLFLNDNGICCSAGSACSSLNKAPSHVLMSLGLSPEEAKSCVRFTLGKNTTEEEINTAIEKINKIVGLMQENEIYKFR